MTREEAEKIVGRGPCQGYNSLEFSVGGFVDLLNRLGVLPLDDPKDASQRLYDQVTHTPLMAQWDDIMLAIDKAGLKLVMK